ncbi:hypothetical protein GJ496_010099 [Pomphorhynchus laevis]|nr:hypothetical protein GJ496_010099 [Pomphorhynchus laevis]
MLSRYYDGFINFIDHPDGVFYQGETVKIVAQLSTNSLFNVKYVHVYIVCRLSYKFKIVKRILAGNIVPVGYLIYNKNSWTIPESCSTKYSTNEWVLAKGSDGVIFQLPYEQKIPSNIPSTISEGLLRISYSVKVLIQSSRGPLKFSRDFRIYRLVSPSLLLQQQQMISESKTIRKSRSSTRKNVTKKTTRALKTIKSCGRSKGRKESSQQSLINTFNIDNNSEDVESVNINGDEHPLPTEKQAFTDLTTLYSCVTTDVDNITWSQPVKCRMSKKVCVRLQSLTYVCQLYDIIYFAITSVNPLNKLIYSIKINLVREHIVNKVKCKKSLDRIRFRNIALNDSQICSFKKPINISSPTTSQTSAYKKQLNVEVRYWIEMKVRLSKLRRTVHGKIELFVCNHKIFSDSKQFHEETQQQDPQSHIHEQQHRQEYEEI